MTVIDPWFLHNIRQIVECESGDPRKAGDSTPTLMLKAKQYGFSDRQIAVMLTRSDEAAIRAQRKQLGVLPVYKTVDTCAAEFAADTPYHYSTYETGKRGDAVRPQKR